MRYALISDIHANLPALRAVLADIDARKDVDAIYHLGDLTGYAPWPNEAVALLRERGIPGIAGNYDSTVAADYKHCGCRADTPHDEELSHVSYEWTRANVTPETRKYLGSLPFRMDIRPLGGHVSGPTITLVHGNQSLNTVYVTDDRPDSFLEKMAGDIGARAGDVVCFGHTHKPWQRTVGGIQFINTGSVGRPKDGDWRACYVLLTIDQSAATIDFVRVSYDVDEASDAIRRSDLPDEFAEVLKTGGAGVEAARQ
ncbi:MAG TPA: metallophosphoesterase family protein [Gemmatimonadaceae bacterium]|jgi:predicted phosphodiesterase|nr:metallophosphoesterase family protein [Gemmatimonadaceae bacterium]